MQGAETASNLQLLDITQPEVCQVQPAATRQVLDYMHHLTRHRMDVARHLVDLEVPQLEQLVHQIAGVTVNTLVWLALPQLACFVRPVCPGFGCLAFARQDAAPDCRQLDEPCLCVPVP